jgi:hypothetical protein
MVSKELDYPFTSCEVYEQFEQSEGRSLLDWLPGYIE